MLNDLCRSPFRLSHVADAGRDIFNASGVAGLEAYAILLRIAKFDANIELSASQRFRLPCAVARLA